ncbi:MAG: ABC transporter ATP-binding protein [Planctomycetes bacterium]|nr:ABC transporter ATP-binding protein [Planctomycetota bacterium]
MSAEPLLRVHGLCAGYGPVDVLHDVALEVRQGEIVSLIGANGAGKSSTLRCISRILAARSGSLRFAGRDLLAMPAHDVVAAGLAHVPEGRRIFPRLTVLENLEMGAYRRGDAAAIARDLHHVRELFPILRDRERQQGGTLSGGEQQMLAIGRAMMSEPRLLMMDEPSMGIAPILVTRIFDAVKRLRDQGMTILLVEQNARAALRLSDRAYVMETGRITLSGTGAELLQDRRVQEAYLGD